jgi:hypothetical protein
VALLRLWVLSQPINLEKYRSLLFICFFFFLLRGRSSTEITSSPSPSPRRKQSKTNPTFFEALESWKFPKERKSDLEKYVTSPLYILLLLYLTYYLFW